MWSLPDGDGALRRAGQAADDDGHDARGDPPDRPRSRSPSIERQMLVIAKKLGFSDLKSVQRRRSRRTRSSTPIARGDPATLPQVHRPDERRSCRSSSAGCRRRRSRSTPVEAFREKEASGAQYNQGAKDGSRPGRVMVNTSEPEKRARRSRWSRPRTTRACPGHHLQISIAQELESCRRSASRRNYSAYVEGWALYSERLGKEVGFYQDPYSDYGRLQDEMLRAIRLVVDTGFHCEEVDARPGRAVLPRPLGDRRGRGAERDRPLHRRGPARRSATRSAS